MAAHCAQHVKGADVWLERAIGLLESPSSCAILASNSRTVARMAEKTANFEAFGSNSIGSMDDVLMEDTLLHPGPVAIFECSFSLIGACERYD